MPCNAVRHVRHELAKNSGSLVVMNRVMAQVESNDEDPGEAAGGLGRMRWRA